MSLSRILANIGTALDSASTGDFLSKVDSDGVFGGVAYSSVTGTPTVLDSANVTNLIDSAYIQLRQTAVSGGGLDSATTISFVDSDYITSRATASGFQMFEYDATAGQTEFTGSDVNGNTLAYSEYGLLVHYNGILLSGATDYTATDGTTVVLTDSADADARITIAKWSLASAGGGGGSGPAWYGDRAVLGGGYSSNTDTNAIEYFDISNLGNGADFGDISAANRGIGGLSNGSKAVFGGGGSGTFINTMDQITTSTLGNSTDFGDLTVGRYGTMGTGDGTYGLFIGGITSGWSYVNTVDYITVASPGNATDFGDCIKNAHSRAVGSNGTRAVAMCGEHGSSPYHTDDIDYFTIASPGNATDFGNMTDARAAVIGNLDDGTYACCAGGYNYSTSAMVNTIDYITVATTGNATDFGDLLAVDNVGRGVNNGSRGCVCGDYNQSNTIQYITISSPGNAQDFGDLNAGRYECGAASGSPS